MTYILGDPHEIAAFFSVSGSKKKTNHRGRGAEDQRRHGSAPGAVATGRDAATRFWIKNWKEP